MSNFSSCYYQLYNFATSLVGCTNDIMTSDHSPVFSTFEVGVASQFVSKHGTVSNFTRQLHRTGCVTDARVSDITVFYKIIFPQKMF